MQTHAPIGRINGTVHPLSPPTFQTAREHHAFCARVYPFAHTGPAAVATTLARLRTQEAVERDCIASAIRDGRSPEGHRRHLARIQSAIRNGEEYQRADLKRRCGEPVNAVEASVLTEAA